jgi:hypothetical protein
VAQNSFYFADGTNTAEDMFTFWADKLQTFFDDTAAGGPVIGQFMSNYIDRTMCSMAGYVEGTGPHTGPPFAETALTLPDSDGTTDLPLEVALCLSYRAAAVTGVPQARLRGRIYVGPLTAGAITELTGTHRPTPASTFVTALRNAAGLLLASSGTGIDGAWSLLSRKQATTGGTPFNHIVGGWVDNEWDTQRRRGADPTTRSTW